MARATWGRSATKAGRQLWRVLGTVVDDVVEALFPPRCRHCGGCVEPESFAQPTSRLVSGKLRRHVIGPCSVALRFLCEPCAAALLPVDRVRSLREKVPLVSAFDPSPVFFTLLHAFKYEGFRELAPWFGAYLARAAKRRLSTRACVLLPVPLHAERMRQRGFNQSRFLAEQVAVRLGLPLHPELLYRWRATAPLAGSSASARHAAVQGAFARRGPLPEKTLQLVLVDDVVTTGATCAAAMEALRLPTERLTVLCLCQARKATAPAEML